MLNWQQLVVNKIKYNNKSNKRNGNNATSAANLRSKKLNFPRESTLNKLSALPNDAFNLALTQENTKIAALI